MGCCGDNEVSDNAGKSAEEKYNSPREFDPDFSGPIGKRSCTDVICCLLFFVCILGSGVMAYFAFSQGDPRTLTYPTDSRGNICGMNSKAGKPYLLYFDLLECARMGAAVAVTGCPTPQICVESCPTTSWVFLTLEASEQKHGYSKAAREKQLLCVDNADYLNSSYSVTNLVKDKQCAPYYLNSTQMVGRCVPNIFFEVEAIASAVVSAAGDSLANADNTSVTYQAMSEASKYLGIFLSSVTIAQNVINDVVTAWWMILVGIGIGALVSFIWCLLIRCLACVMVYLTLILFFISFSGACAYCIYQYMNIQTSATTSGNLYITSNLSYYLALRETWLVIGCIAGVIALIVLLILICLRKRIQLAIAILGQASKAVAAVMTTLLFPIFPWIFELAVVGYWGAIAVYLAATGKAMYAASGNGTNPITCNQTLASVAGTVSSGAVTSSGVNELLTCQFLKYGGNDWANYLQGFNLFMFFWLLAFTMGMGQIVLAGTFASWYWAWEKPKDIPAFPVAASLWRTLRYHIGTVAFGSLLIAIVWMIRAFLEYVQHKMKDSANCCAKFCICMLRCCLWCFEKCLRFLTKNAYIVTSIYGKSFCPAAKDAFFLILRNILRLAVVDNVTGFMLFVGKLLVVGAVTTAAFFFFDGSITYIANYKPALNYFFVPVIVIAVGTYVVASLFFNVFGFAVDTLFICVMEDLERNDGSIEKPYFMSKDLMAALDVKNKFKDNPDDREGCFACCTCCCC